MAAIDLRTIKFRAYSPGSDDPEEWLSHAPLAGGSTSVVSLSGIKFRAKDNTGDEADPDTD